MIPCTLIWQKSPFSTYTTPEYKNVPSKGTLDILRNIIRKAAALSPRSNLGAVKFKALGTGGYRGRQRGLDGPCWVGRVGVWGTEATGHELGAGGQGGD